MPQKTSGNAPSRRPSPASRNASRAYGSVSSLSKPNSSTPAAAPAAAPASSPMVQQQQPSLLKEMAATAGGVAVGSAVGHTVGQAITGGLGGGSERQQQAPAQQMQESGPSELTGPCSWEIKQFLQCAQGQTDLSLCEGFNEAIRQCKTKNGLK